MARSFTNIAFELVQVMPTTSNHNLLLKRYAPGGREVFFYLMAKDKAIDYKVARLNNKRGDIIRIDYHVTKTNHSIIDKIYD